MPDLSTCGELADYLATQPRDRPVVMSKDGEGNSYSPLAEAGESMYAADSTWSGERYMTPEDIAEHIAGGGAEDDYWQAPDDAVRAVCLWPVN